MTETNYRIPSFFALPGDTLILREKYHKAIKQAEKLETEIIGEFLRGYEIGKQEAIEKMPRGLRGISKILYSFGEWLAPNPTIWGMKEVLRVRRQDINNF